jgi:hypothetical protein
VGHTLWSRCGGDDSQWPEALAVLIRHLHVAGQLRGAWLARHETGLARHRISEMRCNAPHGMSRQNDALVHESTRT